MKWRAFLKRLLDDASIDFKRVFTPDTVIAVGPRQAQRCFRPHQFGITELSQQLNTIIVTASAGLNGYTVIRSQGRRGVDQNPVPGIQCHLEIPSDEVRKSEPRLIFGFEDEW